MKWIYCLVPVLLLSTKIHAQTQRDKLVAEVNQYTARIQKDIQTLENYPPLPAGTSDKNHLVILERALGDSIQSMREKIILIAQRIKPPLAIPERAREYYVKGVSAMEDPDTKIYNDVIGDLDVANVIAPWWSDVYKQSGKAYEIIKVYDTAIRYFQLYLLSRPSANDARNVQDEIYIIEAKMQAKQ